MKKAVHPGEIVNEYLAGKEWSQADLVRASGLKHKTISRLCNREGGITAMVAIGLENAFEEKPATFWMALQADYDIWKIKSKAFTT